MDSSFRFPGDWHDVLGDQTQQPYWASLCEFLAQQRAEHEVFPPEDEVWSALSLTPYADVKVLILGQDPYHDNDQAHGLSFSVKPGIKTPPSLRNIYKELHADLGCTIPDHGSLISWARQGVLMINAVLTVRAHEANSHKNKGWEKITDQIIRAVNDKSDRVVFLLWGGYARKKAKLIDRDRHGLVEGAHPSPLSVKKFMGSRPFSAVNALLNEAGRGEIDWQVPPL
ncbi:MAG: uracil-DNA glycosylase [Deltaproteobacteria bacterium]|nr:uracil-DNA glycosylase [Deltaproteobacteria bacterium]